MTCEPYELLPCHFHYVFLMIILNFQMQQCIFFALWLLVFLTYKISLLFKFKKVFPYYVFQKSY